MSYGPNASQEYLRNAVMTASSEQLHLMLIDGAVRFTTEARDALARRDFEAVFNGLDRAQRIILELMNGLNPDVNPELVQRMVSLYQFIYYRLVEGGLRRDERALTDALRILAEQRETWRIIIDKISKEVRQNASPQAPTPIEPDASREDEITTGFIAEA